MITETIDSIDDGKILEFRDVNLIVTGSIGKNAKVTIINGSIWVKGSIESSTQIEAITNTIIDGSVSGKNFGHVRGRSPSRNPVQTGTTTIYSPAIGSIFGNGSVTQINAYSAPQTNRTPLPQAIGSIYGDNYGSIVVNSFQNGSQQVKSYVHMDSIGSLTVDGDIGENANIRSFYKININGNVKSNASIEGVSCNIIASNIDSDVKVMAVTAHIECLKFGENSTVIATNTEFHCGEVFRGVKIFTTNGNIVANVVHENASLSLMKGSIQISESRHDTVSLSVAYGSIEIAGVVCHKSRSRYKLNQPVPAVPDNKPTPTPSNDKKSKNPFIAFIGSLCSSKNSDQPSPEPETKAYRCNK